MFSINAYYTYFYIIPTFTGGISFHKLVKSVWPAAILESFLKNHELLTKFKLIYLLSKQYLIYSLHYHFENAIMSKYHSP